VACHLSVIIPCCNEEGNVPVLREQLPPALDRLGVSWELVCVDDGSSDGTLAALRALPGARVLRHEQNQGLAAALKTGIAAAQGEWLVPLDADLSFPVEHLRELLDEQERTGADCVSGSPIRGRFEGVPVGRQIPSRVLNGLYGLLFDHRFTSYTPLLRLYRTARLRRLALTAKGFEVNAEILCLLLRAGARVVEIPVTLRARRWGRSKLRRLRELYRHLSLISRLIFL
jgi:dolichol-phosphate mannosyltransferase